MGACVSKTNQDIYNDYGVNEGVYAGSHDGLHPDNLNIQTKFGNLSERTPTSPRKRPQSPATRRSPALRPLSSDPDSDLVLGRYRKRRLLGETHFGKVWEGLDTHTNRPVAVKQVRRTSAEVKRHWKTNKAVPEDFYHEVQLMNEFERSRDCPSSIIRKIDYQQDDEYLYLVLEFASGGSLFDIVQERCQPGEHNWKECVRAWIRDVAEAVAYLHDKEICHKDISLQNVCLGKARRGRKWEAKLIDFGLAEWFTRRGGCMTTKKVGKSNFASPTCYDPDVSTFDAKANDVWTVGVMLFMCLTKIAPFRNPLDSDAKRLQQGRGAIRRLLIDYRVSKFVSETELDLLAKCFRPESRRVSIHEVVRHPYFESARSRRPLNRDSLTNSRSYVDIEYDSSAGSVTPPSSPREGYLSFHGRPRLSPTSGHSSHHSLGSRGSRPHSPNPYYDRKGVEMSKLSRGSTGRRYGKPMPGGSRTYFPLRGVH